MRCDRDGNPVCLRRGVSIPAGFSDALRPCSFRCCQVGIIEDAWFQSLLGFLMRCDRDTDQAALQRHWFQSLLGFLMRCDLALPVVRQVYLGFNPCWVF